jgi:hypothetical protein
MVPLPLMGYYVHHQKVSSMKAGIFITIFPGLAHNRHSITISSMNESGLDASSQPK